MNYSIIAICDGYSYEIIAGGASRVHLLEKAVYYFKQYLNKDIKLIYDLNKEEIEYQGYHYQSGLYDHLQIEYQSLTTPEKPHLTFWE